MEPWNRSRPKPGGVDTVRCCALLRARRRDRVKRFKSTSIAARAAESTKLRGAPDLSWVAIKHRFRKEGWLPEHDRF